MSKIENLILVKPSFEYQNAFIKYAQEYMRALDDDMVVYREMYSKGLDDFSAYLSFLDDRSKGIGVPEGWTSTLSYWMVNNSSELIGIVRIRVALNTTMLSKYVGNIGYDIKPSERGRGYGTEILRLGLLELNRYGVTNVLVICNASNISSRKVIEKNSGIFESEIIGPDGEHYLRYWIM